jgi:integrase
MAERRTGRSRGNGEGSIYQRESDGRWCCSIVCSDGKRQVLYGKTRAEVAKKLNTALQAREQGIPTPPARLTVDKLLDEWLNRDVRQRPVNRTLESYDFLVRVHLKPALGRKRVIDLTVRDV